MPLESYVDLYRIVTAIVRGQDIAPALVDAGPQFADLAAAHRCGPFVAAALAQTRLTQLAPLRRKLRSQQVACALQNERLRDQIDAVLAVLNEQAITPVLLKGAARIWQRSQGHDLHDSVDLDLLLAPEQLGAAQQSLLRVGYEQRAGASLEKYYRLHHHHAPPLFAPDGGVPIELHHALYLPGDLSLSTGYAAVARYAQPVRDGQRQATAFDAFGEALHLIVHGHLRCALRDIAILAERLRCLTEERRAELRSLLRTETREPVRLEAIAYEAAVMAAIPWPASDAARSFAQWRVRREALPQFLRRRTDCADAVFAHPERRATAFLSAAAGVPRIDEPALRGAVHQAGSACTRAAAGIRILCNRQRAPLHVVARGAIRQAARSNVHAHRIAAATRSLVRRWFPAAFRASTGADPFRIPELRAFVRAARRQRLRANAFQTLAASDFLTAYLNEELTRIARGEYGAARSMEYRSTLTILATPEFRLSARFLELQAEPDEIAVTVRDTLLSPARGTVVMRRFNAPPQLPEAASEGGERRLERLPLLTLQPGNVAASLAGCEAYVLSVPNAPAVVLVLESGATQPVRRRFAAADLRYAGAGATDITVSRLRETLELAAALGDERIAEPAQTLLDHPSHFVRWSALRAVIRLAPERAKPMLRRAANDAHPAVRRAARRSLEQDGASWR